MTGPIRILLISGSTRGGSTNTAVLRTVQALRPAGVVAGRPDHFLTALPAFDPDADREPLPPVVAELRREIARAAAVLFCTPEYAGALPGSFKNLLDWTVGGGELHGRPVAWINAASVAAPTGGAGAHASLATVLGYLGADVVGPACLRLPVPRDAVGADGLVGDPGIRRAIRGGLEALLRHVGAGAAVDRSG